MPPLGTHCSHLPSPSSAYPFPCRILPYQPYGSGRSVDISLPCRILPSSHFSSVLSYDSRSPLAPLARLSPALTSFAVCTYTCLPRYSLPLSPLRLSYLLVRPPQLLILSQNIHDLQGKAERNRNWSGRQRRGGRGSRRYTSTVAHTLLPASSNRSRRPFFQVFKFRRRAAMVSADSEEAIPGAAAVMTRGVG
ncbi:hypothetical protein C8F01DRAFT_635951 [Mycena amicta]|nr:hypothetical protein C8F01DRAFT_635951 [Mycena amicta]